MAKLHSVYGALSLFFLSIAEATSKSSRATCTSTANYTASISFVGCYSDADTRTLAGGEIDLGSTNTPQICANTCGAANYAYAGVEYGSQCYCGNSISSAGVLQSTSSCTSTCAGNSSLVCGGTWLVDVYQISNPLTTGSNASFFGLPDCSTDPLCSNPICDTSLSIQARVAGLINAMTLDEKAANLQNGAAGVARLGLPSYQWWSEALHGVAGSPGVNFESPLGVEWSYATSFPTPILTGAAFNDELTFNIGKIVGTEGRAFANVGKAGLDFWTPNINPFKDPRWGRGLETPGEDPYHLQGYVYNLINGLQGGINPTTKQVIATCKHFAVYDLENGRTANDLNPTPQDLTEYYLPPFKTCARDAKVGAFMCAYVAVDGIPSCANRYLLQTLLREHWNWNDPYNWVTSDCGAVTYIETDHHYVSTDPDAAAAALNAGTDVGCEFGTIMETLPTAVAAGTITNATIDQALSRLYSSQINAGYFDSSNEYASLNWANVGTAEAQFLAYEAAVEGITLLKNNGVLPIPKSGVNVALIGPWANATLQMQGNYAGTAPFLISPLAAMQSAWTNVTYVVGTNISSTDTSGFAAAISAASAADYVIYCGGIDTTVEAEAMDRSTLAWTGNQLTLVAELAALSKPLIVVQFGGGQLDDSTLLSNANVSALVWAGYPGQDGGTAVRAILDGSRSVAGRLPITQYPAAYINEVNPLDPSLRPSSTNPGRTYKWYSTPVLPFGYGLHYTNFSLSWGKTPASTYSIATLLHSASEIIENTPFVTVTATVKNTGGPAKLPSDFVGLLYISTTNAGPSPYPIKSLISYDRVFNVTVNGTATLSFPLTLAAITRVVANGSVAIFPGDYTIALDYNSTITAKFTLTGSETIIESIPVPPTDAVPLSYLGCYTDSTNRTLAGGTSSTLTSTNTPGTCGIACNAAGYSYAGVEYGKECWCAQNITSSATLVADSKCNYQCTGNSAELCGGNLYMNVYKITPSATLEAASYTG